MPESLPTAGQELVYIALVPYVKQDSVPIGIKDPVERHRELHRAEIGGQMASGF